MSASRYDVLVVGGGVAGLACAALLSGRLRGRREGVRIGVVEARAPRTPAAGAGPGLRVFAIAPAAESVLRECGAWQALPPGMAAPYERMRVWQAAGTPFGPGSLSFDAAESGAASLGHIVDHDWLRFALWGRLEAGAVVDLITGVLPQALRPGPDAMVLALADGGTLEARLLVGADGADSWVRGQLGLETTGRSYGQLAIVGHVASEKPHAGTAWQCFLPTGPVALLPLADGRSSFVWSSAEDEARALAALPDDEFAARITAATGRVLGALAMTTPRQLFPLAVRHTHRYTGPRFALVGDAAHQIHPLAGQGINLGLQDVAALAGTVADHLLGTRLADPGDAVVLRRYERGRKGSNLLTMAAMEGLHRVFTSDSAALARLAAAGLGAVDRLPLLKRVLVDQATGGDPGRGRRAGL